jgi:hypothetical protein
MLGLSMPDIDRWSGAESTCSAKSGAFHGAGPTAIVGAGERRLLLDAGQGVDEHVTYWQSS